MTRHTRIIAAIVFCLPLAGYSLPASAAAAHNLENGTDSTNVAAGIANGKMASGGMAMKKMPMHKKKMKMKHMKTM